MIVFLNTIHTFINEVDDVDNFEGRCALSLTDIIPDGIGYEDHMYWVFYEFFLNDQSSSFPDLNEQLGNVAERARNIFTMVSI